MFERQKIYFVICFLILACALSFFLIWARGNTNNVKIENKDYPILIAHAGGSLYGRTYLNSKEAVENSIINGFKYIELDLLETTDEDLLAAHSWKDFHRLTTRKKSEKPISSTDAKKRKILGKQTVLTSKEISDIFLANENLILVTDKIQNLKLLEKKFGQFKDRIIVEVFSVKKYEEAQKRGFKHAAFCVRNSEKLYKQAEENKIDMITLTVADLSKWKKWHENHPEVISLAYGPTESYVNNLKDVEELSFIKGWYTDFLTPKMLENK